MKILIQNGRMIDPANGIDNVQDLLIEEGVIAKVGEKMAAKGAEVIDASGKIVTPGLIDTHVHLRDPGQEYKEDIVSGTRAAAAGGFTSLICMPNTKPVIDNRCVVEYIIRKANEEGSANVFPCGNISAGSKGEVLTEMHDLADAGCVGFSDDGLPVISGEIMLRALEYARPIGKPIVVHAEDLSLTGDGVMNAGVVSTELGLKGIPWVAEDAMVARDIMLAEFTDSQVHICHISTKGAVEAVRQAKARGVKVTTEVTPHHFTLTEEAVRGYDTHAKMSPPLRTAEDVAAMKAGLADGTIDGIATDHAPHHPDEKNVEFSIAYNGIIGLETALPLTLKLVEEGALTLNQAVAALTSQPAKAFGLDRGTLAAGAVADVTVIDPELEWTVDAEALQSKSVNTPFNGWTMKGAAVYTLRSGQVTWKR